MAILTPINVILFIAALVAVVAWASLELKRTKRRDDLPFIINLMADQSDGRAYGYELDSEDGISGETVKIRYQPTDLLPKNFNKAIPVDIIADKAQISVVVKGRLSKEKNIKFILPEHPSDLPEDLKETDLGRALTWLSMEKNFKKNLGELYKEDRKRAENILDDLALGNLSEHWMAHMKGMAHDMRAAMRQEAKDKPFSTTGGA